MVDVACGTGHHAALFRSWNLRVEGSDISADDRPRRASFGESPELRWSVRGFEQPIAPREPLDAALCLGNSLSLAADHATVQSALGQMLAAVRPGGAIVVHLLNLWRLPDGPCVWQKCRRAMLPQGESLIVKGVHRCDRRGYVDLLVATLPEGDALHHQSVPFLGWEAAELEQMAIAAGAVGVQFFGGYQDQSYQREKSIDLLMLAEK